MLFVPVMMLTIFVPIAAISCIGHLSSRNLPRWLGALVLLLCALSIYDVWRADLSSLLPASAGMTPSLPSPGLILLCVPGLFIAQALILAGNVDGRRIAAYPTYFEVAWKLLVQLKFSALFTGLFWLVLFIGNALFALIKLDFLKNLMEHAWFNIPMTTLAFSFALHLSDARPQIVAGIRRLLLMLLSWLLPMATMIVAAFLIGLVFTGLQPLWQTRRASHVLLGSCAMLVLLINTVYQDGRHLEPGKQHFFTACCRLACLLPLPLVALAAYSQSLRVADYGWTVSRIAAASCTLIACVYALGYGYAALRLREPLQRLSFTNIGASLIIPLTMLALLSPLADPARISVASQLQRLERKGHGAVDLSTFNFLFLRFDSARYGVEALQQLSHTQEGENAELIRQGATRALAISKRGVLVNPVPEKAVDLIVNIVPHPAQRNLPQAFLKQDWNKSPQNWDLPACLTRAERRCDAYFVKPDPHVAEQLLIFGENAAPALFATGAKGEWQLLGKITLDMACKQRLQKAAEQGDLHWQAPLQQDLELNGKRLRVQVAPNRVQDCPG